MEGADDIQVLPCRNAPQGDRLTHEPRMRRIEGAQTVQECIAKSTLKKLRRNRRRAGPRQIEQHLRIDRFVSHPIPFQSRRLCHNVAR